MRYHFPRKRPTKRIWHCANATDPPFKMSWDNTNVTKWADAAELSQQDMCDRLGDRRWDSFPWNEFHLLKLKVGFAMYGPPSKVPAEGDTNSIGYTEEQMKNINRITDILIEAGCGRDKVVFFATIFVSGKCDEKNEFRQPVFRVSKNGQMGRHTFIDINGRTYDGWGDYLKSNELPDCLCIYPQNGVYEADDEGKVILGRGESPASSITKKVGTGVDISLAALGVGTSIVGIVGLFTPLAPVVAGVCFVVGTGSGVVGSARGAAALHDKRIHGENINPLKDKEAFGTWLSVIGGAVGASAGVAVRGVSAAAAHGAVLSRLARGLVTGLQIGDLSISGIGIVSGFFFLADKLNNGEEVTILEVYQLTTSIFFFSNALVQPKTASKIIKNAQKKTIGDFKKGLKSNNAKDGFQAVVDNANGSDAMKNRAKVIKGVKEIKSPEEFFNLIAQPQNREDLKNNNVLLKETGKLEVNGRTWEPPRPNPPALEPTVPANPARDTMPNQPYLERTPPSTREMVNLLDATTRLNEAVFKLGVCVGKNMNPKRTAVPNQTDREPTVPRNSGRDNVTNQPDKR